MAPVGERPFLEYLLLQLKKHSFRNITLCIGYGGDLIQKHFGQGHPWGLKLQYSQEQELRGTAGALKLADKLVQGEVFLVMNGDSFFDIDLNILIREHQSRKALVTIALAEVENTQRYGTVEIDEKGNIMRFLEKRRGRYAGLINGGVYVFDREVLRLIPERRTVSLEYEVFPRVIGNAFRGLPFQAYFAHIGIPKDYLRLQADPAKLLAAVS